MVGKRKAEKSLDPDDVKNDNIEGSQEKVDEGEQQDDISKRKIVTVKRKINKQEENKDKEQKNEDDRSNSKLKLFGNLENSDEKQEKPSLFNFTGCNQGTTLFQGGGVFQPSGGLFGFQAQQQPLFSSASGQQTQLFGCQTSTSLFGGPSLFENQSGSLFGNNLFQKKEDQDEEDDEDDSNLGKGNNSPVAFNPDQSQEENKQEKGSKLKIESRPPEKSPYSKIFNKYIEKFKLIKPEEEKISKGNGYLSLEYATLPDSEKKVFICVFRSSIGKTLFQGSLNQKYSKMRRIEEKAYKQQLKLAFVRKDNNKLVICHCVASFSRSDDLIQFEKEFENCLDQIKQQEQK